MKQLLFKINFLLFFVPFSVFGQSTIDTLAPTSSIGLDNNSSTLNTLINQLFWAGLVVAVVLAIVMVILGAIQYMTTDAVSGKGAGKERIKAAVAGLVLAFSTVIILNTINPSLTELNLTFERIDNIQLRSEEILPVELGSRVEDLSVRNTFIDSNGNTVHQNIDHRERVLSSVVITPDGRVFTVYPDGTQRQGGVQNFYTNPEIERMARDLIRSHGLTSLRPRDAQNFFNNGGTEDDWLGLLFAMIKYESDFNPNTTFPENFTNSRGETVISTGLLQLSWESVRGYSNFNPSLRNITTEQLKDPYINLDAGITILKRLVSRDGYISGPNNTGGAAYWSVLRPTGKLRAVQSASLAFPN